MKEIFIRMSRASGFSSLPVLCLFALLFVITGCSRNSKPELPQLVPVQGTVMVNGKPTAAVGLILSPLSDQPEARGFTDENGHFEMKYRGETPGAAPGKYRIQLNVETADGPSAFVPQKYLDGTSPLTIDVPPEGLTEYVLELNGK